MTEYFQILATLAAIRIVLALVPGRDSRLVVIAAGRSRRHGVAVALGLAAASLVWTTAGAVLVAILVAAAPAAVEPLRIVAGLHLLWLGTMAVRHSFDAPLPAPAPSPPMPLARAFRAGALDLLARPRAIACAASIFAVTGAWDLACADQATAVAVFAAVAFAWNTLLAVTVAAPTGGLRRPVVRASARRLLAPLLGVVDRAPCGPR